jgi:hypothetical protein
MAAYSLPRGLLVDVERLRVEPVGERQHLLAVRRHRPQVDHIARGEVLERPARRCPHPVIVPDPDGAPAVTYRSGHGAS